MAQDDAKRVVPTVQGRRLALVIGNQAYASRPLRNPVADARSMEGLLRADLAFDDVQKIEDSNLVGMQKAIREFVRKVRPGDLALFYYSGHGMQVEGNNWMIPVDFHAEFEDDVPDQAYSAQRVLKDLGEAGASVRILILDACRDNPLPAAARRGGKDGLVPMTGSEGTYVLFATAENQTASDNPRGANGLFTGYLVEAMRKPGLTLDQAFKETRREVSAATGGKQRPWLSTDIDRDIVLKPGAPAPGPALDAAAETWALIRDSKDAEDFERFVKAFPQSELARGAAIRADQLRKAAAPVAVAKLETPAPKINPPAPAPASVIEPPKPGPPQTRIGADKQRYAFIEPGDFWMGCWPEDCPEDATPRHKVTITRGFWMADTLVTQAAYQKAMGKHEFAPKNQNGPATGISWADANAYCGKAGMRLPTEAEWEYVAQGRWKELKIVRLMLDGYSPGNLTGNGAEWVSDFYQADYYVDSPRNDPAGPAAGKDHSLRGLYGEVGERHAGATMGSFRCVAN